MTEPRRWTAKRLLVLACELVLVGVILLLLALIWLPTFIGTGS